MGKKSRKKSGKGRKTGRNDPCPCGSGRKYKRCCLDADEQARRERSQDQPRPEPPPLDAWPPDILADARATLESGDFESIFAALNQIFRLLMAGGPLELLRLPDEAVVRVVTEELGEVADPDHDALSDVFERRIADVVPPGFVEDALEDLDDVVRDREEYEEDRQTAAIAWLAVASVWNGDPERLSELPLLDSLLRVQYAEIVRASESAGDFVDNLTDALGGEGADPLEVTAGLFHLSDLVRDILDTPAFHRYPHGRALEAEVESFDIMSTGEGLPPILTGPEAIRLQVAVLEALPHPEAEEEEWEVAGQAAVAALRSLCDREFLGPILRRLAATARDPGLDEFTREPHTAVLSSVASHPVRSLYLALDERAWQPRDAREDRLVDAVLSTPALGPEDLDELLDYLEFMGDAAGLSLVQAARDQLGGAGEE